MKQKIFTFTILFICGVFIYPFCVTAETNLNQQRVQRVITKKVIVKHSKPQANNTNAMYVVRIKVHQTTYTLDPFEYLKNKMNDVEFEIPVDKTYYNTCKVGDKVNDPKFKWGSLIMDGDFSDLKITISGKSIKYRK